MIPKFKGKMVRGIVELQELKAYKSYIKTLEGKEVYLSVAEWKNTRSNNQNNYYWGVVVRLIADTTGYSLQEAHEALKVKFLLQPKIVKEVSLPTIKSTALLNSKEFEDYCAEIREWAIAELDCYIPLPNEVVIEG